MDACCMPAVVPGSRWVAAKVLAGVAALPTPAGPVTLALQTMLLAIGSCTMNWLFTGFTV